MVVATVQPCVCSCSCVDKVPHTCLGFCYRIISLAQMHAELIATPLRFDEEGIPKVL